MDLSDLWTVVERVGEPCWVSHETAAVAWELDLPDVLPGPLHLTVPTTRRRVRRSGVSIHRARIDPDDRTTIGGVPVTGVVRTLIDLARTQPFETSVVAADSALRLRWITLEELAPAGRTLGPRADRVRSMVAAVDPLADSPLETLARLLFARWGIFPLSQPLIRCGDVEHRVDFLLGDLVIELDGYKYHKGQVRFVRDRRRDQSLMAAGYRVVRFTWEDIVDQPLRTIAILRALIGDG